MGIEAMTTLVKIGIFITGVFAYVGLICIVIGIGIFAWWLLSFEGAVRWVTIGTLLSCCGCVAHSFLLFLQGSRW